LQFETELKSEIEIINEIHSSSLFSIATLRDHGLITAGHGHSTFGMATMTHVMYCTLLRSHLSFALRHGPAHRLPEQGACGGLGGMLGVVYRPPVTPNLSGLPLVSIYLLAVAPPAPDFRSRATGLRDQPG
jgi:hypothetical protein